MLPWQQPVDGWMALASGIVSFLSPCVLPLVPAYIGVLAGETAGGETSRLRLLRAGGLFVLGFTLVFVLMGVSASALGQWLTRFSDVLRMVSSILIILMGILTMDILPFAFLQREKRADLGAIAQKGAGRAWMPLVLGIGFAFGWTPCVGPILSSVLLLAANQQTIGQGALLLIVYSLGMAIPFLAIAALSGVFTPLIRRMNRHARWIRRISGALLILLGILMLTGGLNWLSSLGGVVL